MVIYRGEIFYFKASPLVCGDAFCYIQDGALCVAGGKVLEAGRFEVLSRNHPEAELVDYRGYLLMPGFIDAHIHYVQSEITGMYGEQLLDWLENYTFPAEMAFERDDHARRIARLFLQELFRNGTTSCVAFASVHSQSVEALFREAEQHRMCILAGQVQMDRFAPDSLRDRGDAVHDLIRKWHKRGRSRYVITPRFAISCTPELLSFCGQLHEAYPDTYIQTHLSENRREVEQVRQLFPHCPDYLQVYEEAGLLTDHTLFAHGIHLSESEWQRLADAQATVVHCPTSNAFLGSGLYRMQQANDFGVQTALGTDVGAGTSFSMFRTMGAAYGVQQLTNYPMTALEAFYKSTLGTARALHLEHEIGSFAAGTFADFIVVDYRSTVPQQLRMDYLERTGRLTIENKLFGLQTLADDRAVRATYIAGRCVHAL